MSSTSSPLNSPPLPPPIVYTIAGSDSGGGAGIQADLHAIQSFGCHGCSAITCLTAQNSCGVTGIHAPPSSFLLTQLEALTSDLPPRAIKIGMLGTAELAEAVESFLEQQTTTSTSVRKPWVVLDPVMISTSGHSLIDDEAKRTMIDKVFPHADVLTPNKYEAEALLGRKLETPEDVEQGAKDILAMGVKAVLIKGGHSLTEQKGEKEVLSDDKKDINCTLGFAQDYFLSSSPSHDGEPRLCDGDRGVWLRTDRYDSEHTHGTGCTLSSSIASALALSHQRLEVQDDQYKQGATRAIHPLDACCLAKAYVTAGIGRGQGLGKGPGPVAHAQGFPSTHQHFPRIALDPKQSAVPTFLPMKAYSSEESKDSSMPMLGRIMPIVDTVEWIEKLTQTPGVTDIQLRIKDEVDKQKILERVRLCQEKCSAANIRLWINDFWEAAIEASCFGVHVGQEDLLKCMEKGGLEKLQNANLALGISTHSYGELAAALAMKPSYISLGPIFQTTSKKVNFDPQGLEILSKWRKLIDPEIPLVVIGSISNADVAKEAKEAGADCVAVIGAITKADNTKNAVKELNQAMS